MLLGDIARVVQDDLWVARWEGAALWLGGWFLVWERDKSPQRRRRRDGKRLGSQAREPPPMPCANAPQLQRQLRGHASSGCCGTARPFL
jgi:hypothetical protein